MSGTFPRRARPVTGPALACLLASATLPSLSGAQSLPEAAQAIQQMIDTGQGPQAVAAARQFLRQVTGQVGFGVTNAQLTVTPAEGFGMFQPRPNNIFALGEPVYAYVEVYGFSMSQLTNGANRLLFDVSFTLESPQGQQMTDSLIPMGEVQLDSFSSPVDGFFHLTYRINGAVGDYVLRTLVVDRATGQRAEFRLPVIFADPVSPENMAEK